MQAAPQDTTTGARPAEDTMQPGTQSAGPGSATQWAVVELMGHARIAGAITEQSYGGAQLVRVDVPQVVATDSTWRNGADVPTTRTIPAHSRSFGASAIYSINWCDELTATVAAHSIKHELIKPYSLKAALASLPEAEQRHLLALTAGSTTAEDSDELF